MANAVGIYRDMPLADRNNEASFAAILAYLEDAIPPQPPPLPPLAFTRRVASENLPPVRNLLTHPEDSTQSTTNKANTGTAQQPNVVNTKVSSIAHLVETPADGNIAKSQEKPLKRGPKGPRKYSAPRPLGPLKPIAPKVTAEEKSLASSASISTEKSLDRRAPPKRTPKKQQKPDKSAAQPLSGARGSADSSRGVEAMNLAGLSTLELPHPFSVADFGTLDATLLTSGSSSIDRSISTQTTPYHELPQGHFHSLQNSPQMQHPSEPTMSQSLLAAIAYTSPEATFPPTSDTSPTGFTQIYPSPTYPPTQSGHGSPLSNLSPLQSMHNSPKTFRSAPDSHQPIITPTSPVHPRGSRRVNESIQRSVHSIPETFPTSAPKSSIAFNETSAPQSTGKRKRGQDKAPEPSQGKRRHIKPRTAVTAIQSVLNPANDVLVEQTPVELTPSAIPHSERTNTSPKRKRAPRPLSIEMPNSVPIPILQSGHTTPRLGIRSTGGSGYNTPRLLVPNNMSPAMNEPFAGVTNLNTAPNRQYDLQTANSLSMVLNSEAGSSLASPHLYAFSPLDTQNTQANDMMTSAPRDSSGRLPVQSLLSLPPLPATSSPSMQVMQIQPSLLEQSHLQLSDGENCGRQPGDDPFGVRLGGDEPTTYGGGLSDGAGGSMHPSSSWAEILLQPTPAPTFTAELANNEQLLESQYARPDDRNAAQLGYADAHPPIDKSLAAEQPPLQDTDKFVQESVETQNQSDRKNKRRRGKHSRYLAAQGKNGEPDKTHIDVLVKVIQTTETSNGSPEPPQVNNTVTEVSFPMLSHQNSLPSIETLQLNPATNVVTSSHERELLDEMAGISSSNEHGSNNVSFNMLDFLPENLEWNDLLLSGGSGAPNRYNQHPWDQQNYQETAISEETNPVLPPTPHRIRSRARAGRKSDESNKQTGQDKNKEQPGDAKSRSKGQFACTHPGCSAKFLQQQHLKTHMDSHRGIKPFRCDFEGCHKMFSQKGNLKAHQRKHTGEKPFVCEHCDRAFAQKGNLQTHKMIHSGSKPYVCLIDNCTARYSQRGNLKMHQNKFHTETIQKLTAKAKASAQGGPALDEGERKVADHLKILYKFANKGIKGRGKKDLTDRKSTARNNETETRRHREQNNQQRPAERIYEPPTLLPPPPSVGRVLAEGTPSYLLSGSASSWSRPERMEDVFVGGGQGHVQAQSNSFLTGISGDAGSVGLGGYAFGSLG